MLFFFEIWKTILELSLKFQLYGIKLSIPVHVYIYVYILRQYFLLVHVNTKKKNTWNFNKPSSLKAKPIVAGAWALAVELVNPTSPRVFWSSNG